MECKITDKYKVGNKIRIAVQFIKGDKTIDREYFLDSVKDKGFLVSQIKADAKNIEDEDNRIDTLINTIDIGILDIRENPVDEIINNQEG